MTCDGMLNHPWMKLDLSAGKKLAVAKSALEKYVSVRKEKSYKNKKTNDDDHDL